MLKRWSTTNIMIMVTMLFGEYANKLIASTSTIVKQINNKHTAFGHIKNGIPDHVVLIPYAEKLFHQDAITPIIAQIRNLNCRLPSASEFGILLNETAVFILLKNQSPSPFYWVAGGDPKLHHYAFYFHIPTRTMMEYGELAFPAHLLLICQ